MQAIRKVDQNALRTNQAFIISLLLLAFLLDAALVVALVGGVLLLGALYPPLRLFVLVYQHLLKPLGLVQPDVIPDNPEPHRFSMLLGGIFTLAGAVFLYLGAGVLGWGLAWLVIALASLNLFLGFCVGCFMYYHLHRLGVPGFNQAPIEQASIDQIPIGG